MSRSATGLLLWVIAFVLAGPAFPDAADYAGRPVQEVLDELREGGLPLVYSTNLVLPSFQVNSEPAAGDPEEIARAVLAPHGLGLTRVDQSLVVVRLARPSPLPQPVSTGMTMPADDLVELTDITVSASRYILYTNSQFYIDQRAIQALPDLGEDPIRAAHRLPGAAASGLSSRMHFRGGEHNENAIYLNGLELVDPFHIRDYHNIFSSIDARAISGMEAYSGGFPAIYGDHMSGVLLLESARADEPVQTELGLSVYNTSLLNSGYKPEAGVDWLVSARSSNLDVLLDDDLGSPDYFDVFAELGIEPFDGHRVALNLLYADDQVVVTTESDPEELEQSVSDTRNGHAWLVLDSDWSVFLSSRTVLSYSSLENRRQAEANDPERMIAAVLDERDVETVGIRQDWVYAGLPDHTLRWGWGLRRENARFDYQGSAEYRGFYANYPGIENPVRRSVQAAPEGYSYFVYLNDRWQVGEVSALELGLRWDRQTYTGPASGDQLSPRLSFLRTLAPRTDLRLTWGRYYQSQAIQDLQVEDGLSHYFDPQRSDHWIAGIQHRFETGLRLRAEAFYKHYEPLKPRFENLFDPLALIPELAPDRVAVVPENARSYGLETTLESRGGAELDWWVSYTWSKAYDRVRAGNEPRSWDQRHALQAGLAWERGPWTIGLALNLHSGWPTTGMSYLILPPDPDDEEEEDILLPVPGPRNAERLGAFAQLDFRVSREFQVKYGRLSAFLEVSNLTNRKNPCCVDYDVDEDDDGEYFLDASEEYWLPIIPAVGLVWTF